MKADAYKYATRTNGEVVIFHNGKMAKMLRDEPAQAFLKAVKDGDAQAIMAETVGNDGQNPNPASGTGGAGRGLGGDGAAHGHKEFRRKSGS